MKNALLMLAVVSASVAVSASAQAQTVFLPSFQNFSYRGSVSVPDGGRIRLGGVNSSREQAQSAGVPGLGNVPGLGRAFGNRSISRGTEASNLSATAKVLVMSELEAQHLANAGLALGQRQTGANAEIQRKAAFITRHIGRSAVGAQQNAGGASNSYGNRR